LVSRRARDEASVSSLLGDAVVPAILLSVRSSFSYLHVERLGLQNLHRRGRKPQHALGSSLDTGWSTKKQSATIMQFMLFHHLVVQANQLRFSGSTAVTRTSLKLFHRHIQYTCNKTPLYKVFRAGISFLLFYLVDTTNCCLLHILSQQTSLRLHACCTLSYPLC
jgi:hypothetical protein